MLKLTPGSWMLMAGCSSYKSLTCRLFQSVAAKFSKEHTHPLHAAFLQGLKQSNRDYLTWITSIYRSFQKTANLRIRLNARQWPMDTAIMYIALVANHSELHSGLEQQEEIYA